MIVQCDFDGTITMNNLSVLLRNEFARGEWREVEADYFRRRLTVEQSNRKQYVLIKEPKKVLVDFVRQNIEVRPGFLEFVEHCKANGIRFVIVSSGLDFYIKTVLRNISAPAMELYCGQTSFGKNGIAVTYFDPEGNRIEGGFKDSYLAWLRNSKEPVVYIGDGLSDFDAASTAEYVFAIEHLHTMLSNATIQHYTFSDFNDIRKQMSSFPELPQQQGR
jgi:2-hydroxy-3-keto-5-methylthiopentenyl-1-phosphate phosphatase